jgi:diguanylate cyclase (GGDEF)-like protein
MYNQELATSILRSLGKAFPQKTSLLELKATLPEYSQLSDKEWMSSIDALRKDGMVTGKFFDRGFHGVLETVANLEISSFGRQTIGNMGLALEDSLRDELDSVTRLYVRSRFDQDIMEMIERATALQPLSLIMIDVDHFKSVNDKYGHPVGDQVLRTIAAATKSGTESRGSCYRYGGEELAVLLPNHPLDDAFLLADRLRSRIAQLKHIGGPEGVTASFGISCYPETTNQKATLQLVKDADAALYWAKAAGRNCVRKGAQTSDKT